MVSGLVTEAAPVLIPAPHVAGTGDGTGPWRTPGAVALVACYELGHQPLSLAWPLAALRRAGFDPVAVDTAVEDLADETILAARFVGIAVPMHTALRLGIRVARRVRRLNPDAHVCFYGLYATLNAGHLLAGAGDTVISGEVERPLVALVEALETGREPSSVAGIGTVDRPAPPVIERVSPGLPDRRGLPPVRSYAGLELAERGTIVPAGSVEATRGCHHTCLHCPITPIYGGKITVVPREVVLADARAQVAAGARHLTFGDPDFFNAPGHGLRICRELRTEFPWLSFDVTIKVEHLIQHVRYLPELAALGCAFIVSAVESINDDVLIRLDKGHTGTDVVLALRNLDGAGLSMRPSLLPFTPWETLGSYRDLLRFIVEEGLVSQVDPIMLAIRLLVPPGSALLDEPGAKGWVGDLDADAFTHRWNHPDPRMDRLWERVSAIVERDAAAGTAVEETFTHIWAASHEVAGDPVAETPRARANRRPSPRLTEQWFC